jgi:2-methylisocitrate lyase-like PEP mutase family enzyme
MLTQPEKGRAFRARHERDGAFVIPNPWDMGTPRLLETLGL